jgi:micrococcal nuclease
MKRWIFVLPILAIALFLLIPKPQRSSKTELPTPSSSPQSKPSLPPAQTWQVIKVADGDTITVIQGDRKEKIRFCGIDANESQQKGGQEAKAYLRSLIDKGDGTVIVNPIEKDRYGRTVAELFVKPRTETPDSHSGEAIFLNGEMVKAGFARHYSRYSSTCPGREIIEQSEAIAIANHAGVWGDPSAIPPWEFRKLQRQSRGN